MTMLETLARRGHLGAIAALDAYNPDQPRDERGRWGEGGPGSGAASASEHEASAKYHRNAADEHKARGEHDAATRHAIAAGAHEHARAQFASHASIQKELGAFRSYTKEQDPSGSAGRMADLREKQASMQKVFADSASAKAHEASAKANQESAKVRGGGKGVEDGAKNYQWSTPGPKNVPGPTVNSTLEAAREVIRTSLNKPDRRDVDAGNGGKLSQPRALTSQEKPSTLRTTQTEMPAVKEASVSLMAPHSQLPVGNEKPKEPIFADLRRTQELPVVNTPMAVSGRAGTTKESRRDAAAASAGRWASRALETAAKKPQGKKK